jgi:hypothetical protein
MPGAAAKAVSASACSCSEAFFRLAANQSAARMGSLRGAGQSSTISRSLMPPTKYSSTSQPVIRVPAKQGLRRARQAQGDAVLRVHGAPPHLRRLGKRASTAAHISDRFCPPEDVTNCLLIRRKP